MAWKRFQKISALDVCHIDTSKRRYVGKVNKKMEEPYWDACPTEMDNHADTHCFGRNFRPLSFTSEECTVAPFLAEYSEQLNIPICTGATACTLDSGECVILVFGQGLWFGNRMDKTLLNPNQCRSFGIMICDDPTDPHRPLGIEIDNQNHIMMNMNGSTCGFITRCPTDDELNPNNCRQIVLSDELKWNPSDNIFQISMMEEEYRYSNMSSSRIINLVQSNIPCAPLITQIRNDVAISEFDRTMASISTELAPTIMIDKLISKVKVARTRKGYATITHERHHAITPDLLSRKWGIGLDKAKATLACTTQENIRSAVLPLTRRYRTDLLSQRLKRLSCTMWTDTLFAKEKSLLGHTCAQIFTDGEGFVYVHPMTTKAHAGDALNCVTRDIGIPNTLISDNAGEQDGKDTEMQECVRRCKMDYRTTEPYSAWQNRAEGLVKLVKSKAKRRRIRRRVPQRVWDFGMV